MGGASVLVVDKGGRGNAIAWCFARSPQVERVYVAPGNAGSSLMEKCEQVPIKSIGEMVRFVERRGIDLTFVGPEGYLSDGIVNRFHRAGLRRIVGPTREATILESSKCDTKDFLHEIGVPIPEYRNFSDVEEARRYVREFYEEHRDDPRANLVVKADGLAAGKGSIVCNSLEDALYALDLIMVKRFFGDAGRRVDIERRLYGRELMFFVLTDGRTVLPLEAAMDYKPAYDEWDIRIRRYWGGINPNTGGMGGYSPHPWLNEGLREKIMRRVVVPTVRKFRELRGLEYRGVLYFGLMICEEDGEQNPYVLEINVRMGDPEAQVILPRLETDFYEVSEAILEGRLNEVRLRWDPTYRLGICAVSGRIVRSIGEDRGTDWFYGGGRGEEYDERMNIGYPGPHITSQPITGLEKIDPRCIVFHNGTEFARDEKGNIDRSRVLTSGGRVLTLVSQGETLQEARELAYREIRKIRFRNMRYRWDIGKI